MEEDGDSREGRSCKKTGDPRRVGEVTVRDESHKLNPVIAALRHSMFLILKKEGLLYLRDV